MTQRSWGCLCALGRDSCSCPLPCVPLHCDLSQVSLFPLAPKALKPLPEKIPHESCREVLGERKRCSVTNVSAKHHLQESVSLKNGTRVVHRQGGPRPCRPSIPTYKLFASLSPAMAEGERAGEKGSQMRRIMVCL